MKKNKMIITGLIATMMISSMVTFATIGKDIQIFVNGEKIELEVAAEVKNDTTMVPLRVIAEHLGAEVDWNSDKRTIHITRNEKQVWADGGESGEESGDPSSPILALDQKWTGIINGMELTMTYNKTGKYYSGSIENVTNEQLKNVVVELNLKQGSRTVVELGPKAVGTLNPGESKFLMLRLADEPGAMSLAYDGWQIHPEANEMAEGESGEATGHEEGNENSLEEGSEDQMLGKNETYDVSKNGGRLVLSYDEASKSFKGYIKNTSGKTLSRARVEIHLSNGVELGPTRPVNIGAYGYKAITIPTAGNVFSSWVTHVEYGASEGEDSGESRESSEGRESNKDNSSREGRESGGNGERNEGNHNENGGD